MKKSITAFALIVAMLFTSCATIVSGSKQNVKFMSNPSQATIVIDNVEVGKTPFETKLARKSSHTVKIKLDGYKPFETTLTRKFNAWFIGNILFGGLVGLVVDPLTGAMYRLTPKEVNAEMAKGTAFNYKKGDIHIAVALDIDPNWEKVGQLER
jgi:hypothetical protein